MNNKEGEMATAKESSVAALEAQGDDIGDDPVRKYLEGEIERLNDDLLSCVQAMATEEKRHLLQRGRLEGIRASINDDIARVKTQIKDRKSIASNGGEVSP